MPDACRVRQHEAAGTLQRRVITPRAMPGPAAGFDQVAGKTRLAYFRAGAAATNVVGGAKAVASGASIVAVFLLPPS